MSDKQLNVVFCWHMHQPEYRDVISQQYHQPWTYLHAIKDYVDMAAHLQKQPDARAVVNFTPTLLEQLQDYAKQIREYLHSDKALTDPMLDALVCDAYPLDSEYRLKLITNCLRANKERLIDRFPAFLRLAEMAKWLQHNPTGQSYIADHFLSDLIAWYHLAWIGETVRREHPLVIELMEKEQNYTASDRRSLLALIYELTSSVIPSFKALQQEGKVELSVTPYAHPIVPLLLDLKSTHEAMPDATLPKSPEYPGGTDRVMWHMEEGLRVFEECFGFLPQGCWPSEGSVSIDTLKLLNEFNIKWVATGESVLRHSLHRAEAGEQTVHRPYRMLDCNITCFFRDDRLSDDVGFEYAKWHADDAVANLVSNLENIARSTNNPEERVVTVILDGENAWEYYPENGFYFLSVLYERIAKNSLLKLTTFSECLQQQSVKKGTGALPTLVAGSWVYGTFSTWIGDKDKNRGWDMLCDAKKAFDKVIDGLSEAERVKAERQLAICEGSDWFWWFGDYNPAHSVSDFESLYRTQLAALYQLLKLEAPDYLSRCFTHGGGDPLAGGAMRKN